LRAVSKSEVLIDRSICWYFKSTATTSALSLSLSLKNNSSMMRWARVEHISLSLSFYSLYFSSSNLFWASSLAQSTKLVFGFEFKPKYNTTPAREKVKKYGSSQLSRTRRPPSFGGVSPNKYPFLCVCVPSEKYPPGGPEPAYDLLLLVLLTMNCCCLEEEDNDEDEEDDDDEAKEFWIDRRTRWRNIFFCLYLSLSLLLSRVESSRVFVLFARELPFCLGFWRI